MKKKIAVLFTLMMFMLSSACMAEYNEDPLIDYNGLVIRTYNRAFHYLGKDKYSCQTYDEVPVWHDDISNKFLYRETAEPIREWLERCYLTLMTTNTIL